MADSKPQLGPKAKAPFTDTEVGVILEDIDDKLAFIVESQQTLTAGLAVVRGKEDVLTETVGEIKVELTEVNQKLDRKVDRSEFKRLDHQVSVLEAAK
jgi:hypothetical protein